MGTGKKVYSIVLGLVLATSFSSAAMAEKEFIEPEQPLALGDADSDYVFTPVTPCRIVNTKALNEIITGGTTMDFLVYGAAGDLDAQGGNAAGCPSPVGEPLGVHVNVTVVPGTTKGNVRVYPAEETTPLASLVNFKPGVNIANAATIKTTSGTSAEMDLEVYASQDAYVIMDVMGYYSAPEATALDVYADGVSYELAAGEEYTLASPACDAGYSLTGGSCDKDNYSPDVTTAFNYGNGSVWVCEWKNNTGAAVSVRANIVCAGTPGR